MRKIACTLLFISISFLLCGCAAIPVKQEVPLPSQMIGQAPSEEGMVRLVIFNDSDFLLYGLDNSGKINVSINGKGVGRLSIGHYVIVEVSEGKHTVHLEHKDIVDFHSDHVIDIKEAENYLRISAKMTSNKAELVKKPADFEGEFIPEY